MKARLLGAGALALLLAAGPAQADVDVGIYFGGAAIHGNGFSLYFGSPYYSVPYGYISTRPHYTRHYYRYDYPRYYERHHHRHHKFHRGHHRFDRFDRDFRHHRHDFRHDRFRGDRHGGRLNYRQYDGSGRHFLREGGRHHRY